MKEHNGEDMTVLASQASCWLVFYLRALTLPCSLSVFRGVKIIFPSFIDNKRSAFLVIFAFSKVRQILNKREYKMGLGDTAEKPFMIVKFYIIGINNY